MVTLSLVVVEQAGLAWQSQQAFAAPVAHVSGWYSEATHNWTSSTITKKHKQKAQYFLSDNLMALERHEVVRNRVEILFSEWNISNTKTYDVLLEDLLGMGVKTRIFHRTVLFVDSTGLTACVKVFSEQGKLVCEIAISLLPSWCATDWANWKGKQTYSAAEESLTSEWGKYLILWMALVH